MAGKRCATVKFDEISYFEKIFFVVYSFRSQEKGVRQGYMGHLISITNKLVELCSTTTIGQFLKDNIPEVSKKLKEFKETTLSETNKVQFTLLVQFEDKQLCIF